MNKEFDIQNLVRENIKNLQPYSSARDEYVSDGSEMVFLDANENPFENGVNRYPDPQQRSLKDVLAEQKGIQPENILLGNGSDEVLDLLFRAFCEPRTDNIISLPPTYGMYKVLCGTNAIDNKEVLLTTDFQPDIAAILKAIDAQTKMLFICSPNNPTGNTISEEKIIQLLNNFNGLVVIDEAYIDFSKARSWVVKLGQYKNLVVTQTLSKAYGMAGIRLGICMASPEMIGILNKIKPPYNINELTQERGLQRVRNIEKVNTEVSRIVAERKRVAAMLKPINFVKRTYDSDANFILTEVDDANKRYLQLLDNGIVVRNRTTQPLCENTLRFTIGTKVENDRLIEVLKKISL